MCQCFGNATNYFPFVGKSTLISPCLRLLFMHTDHRKKQPLLLTNERLDNIDPENIQTQIREEQKGPVIERGFRRIYGKSTLLPIRNHHASVPSIDSLSKSTTDLCIGDKHHRSEERRVGKG